MDKLLVSLCILCLIGCCCADPATGIVSGISSGNVIQPSEMNISDLIHEYRNISPDEIPPDSPFQDGSDILLLSLPEAGTSATAKPGEVTSSTAGIPVINSYDPDHGSNSTLMQTVSISGSGFLPGLTANLTNGTYRQKNVTAVSVTSPEEMRASFNLQGMSPGRYWIEARNPAGYISPKNLNLTFGSSNLLTGPAGVAVDISGNIYVADAQRDQVQKFNAAGEYLTGWGSGGYGDGEFSSPWGICVDGSGNVYVADTDNSRIQKFDSNGTYLTQWGSYGTGNGQLNRPFGPCADSSGNIYVADSGNNRIVKFNSTGHYITGWGSYGTDPGQFNWPRAVGVDSAGNVYVVDCYNNRIQKFDAAGTYLTEWGSEGSDPGQFDGPRAISFGTGDVIYVADLDNNRIQKFTSTGTFLGQWGSYGSGPVQFNSPYGVNTDAEGNVYVADYENSRIQKFSAAGIFLASIGNPAPDTLNYPQGICSDRSGNVYVADSENNRVVKFTSSGEYLMSWGSRGVDSGQFRNPVDVGVDSSGNVYVLDSWNYRIQKFTTDGQYLTQWGSYGHDPWQFEYPFGMAVDNAGNVFVTDIEGARVMKFSSVGAYLGSWGSYGSGPGEFATPSGICIDASGNVFVSDTENFRIQKFTSAGIFLGQWGSVGMQPGQFFYPVGIGADRFGNVFVADIWNYRIQVFDASGSYLTELSTYEIVPDQYSMIMDVCVNDQGDVYGSDQENNRIHKFSNTPFTVTPWTPPLEFHVNATAGQGGSISPSGVIQVMQGSSLSFAMTPDPVYEISAVIVDGVDQGALSSYTFPNINANHTIAASFVHSGDQYLIHATADQWTINHPAGLNAYPAGLNHTQVTQAKPGAQLLDVTVDGIARGANDTWTFTNLSADHTIATEGTVKPGQVQVVFSATPRSGQVPLNVTFTDGSYGEPTSWFWQFGDGNTSSLQNPTHLYSTPGSYTVILQAMNSQTGGYGVWDHCINVRSGPEPTLTPVPMEIIPAFSGSPQSGDAPLSVQFTDLTSGNPTSWFWDFGDGHSSTLQNPVNQYDEKGQYSVTLHTQNAQYSGSVTKSNYILVN